MYDLTNVDYQSIIQWIVESGDPWVRYKAMQDLMGISESELVFLKKEILNEPRIQSLIQKIEEVDWRNPPWSYLRDAKMPVHVLSVLTDFGISVADLPVLREIFDDILSVVTEQGEVRYAPYIKYPLTCLSSTLLFPVIRGGLKEDERVRKAVNIYLSSGHFSLGWKCLTQEFTGEIFFREAVNSDYRLRRKESFLKSMIKKNIMCPLTTLNILKVLLEYPEYHSHAHIAAAVNGILRLWETRERPYGFGIGTSFGKLKYPFIWYDVLKMAYILSHFEFVWNDSRFINMLNFIFQKKDEYGRFYAESVYIAWKDFDFGVKNKPSPWITYIVYYILSKNPNTDYKI